MYVMKFFPLIFAIIPLSCQPLIMREKTDHIILAINDLTEGIKQFKELTGIEPIFGGVHPNTFTQNALVAIDNGSYLEIIAPRSDIGSIPDWIKKLDKLTPYGWAVTSYDIEGTQKKLKNNGLAVTVSAAGSRKTSSGGLLSWTTFGMEDKDSSVYPFFIKWGSDVIHPSQTTPEGCKLSAIHIHSDDKDILAFKDLLKLDFLVKVDSVSKLVFQIESPKGKVVFEGN